MTTRISKIARLPKPIREELNRRLENGQMVREIEQWLNTLPETKATMDQYFDGRTIRHQNISEWRRTGYQDWLQHNERLEWFDRFSEQDIELKKHDRTADDSFEALGRFFIIEIGLGLAALQQIKNPHDRSEKMQHLAREFARLQNAYNWSRRCLLEWKKYNYPGGAPLPRPSTLAPQPSAPPPTPRPRIVRKPIQHHKCGHQCVCKNCHPEDGDYPYTQAVKDAASKESRTSDYWIRGNERWVIDNTECHCPCDLHQTPARPERQGAGALRDAPRNPETNTERASVPECGSPLPLSDNNSQTPKLPNSQTPKECQPVQTPATPILLSQPYYYNDSPRRHHSFGLEG